MQNNSSIHKTIACILLVSLFLQSCLNSPISPISLKQKHQVFDRKAFDKGKLTQADSYEQVEILHNSTQTVKQKFLTVIEDRLQIEPSKEHITASNKPHQFSSTNHIKKDVRHKTAIQPLKKTLQKNQARNSETNIKYRPNSTIKEQSSKHPTYIFKNRQGQLVKIYQQGEKYQAKVKERIGIFKGKSQLLPVYFEPEITLKQLKRLPQLIQEQYIHVALSNPSINQPGYVYIGKVGLLGGMKRSMKKEDEDQKEKNPQEEKEKEPRSSSFDVREFGSSWRNLAPERIVKLRDVAEENGEEEKSLLGGSHKTDEDLDDEDFFFLERDDEQDGFSAEIYKDKSWFKIPTWLKQKSVPGSLIGKKIIRTDNTEKNREKGKEKEKEKEKEDISVEDKTFYEHSNIVPNNNEEAVPSESIQGRIFRFFPQGPNIEDSLSSVRSLLTSAAQLEQGDENQQKTLRLLEYMYDRILQGKLTRKQMLVGGVGGFATLLGVGSAVTTLFSNDAYNIIKTYIPFNREYVLYFLDSFTYYYAQWVISIDAAYRNAITLAYLSAPSSSDFEYVKGKIAKNVEKAINILIYGASGLVGLLLCYSLYKIKFNDYQFMTANGPAIDPIFGFCFSALPLLVDDMLYFGSRLTPPFQNFIYRHFLQGKGVTENSQAENWRCQSIREFDNLERLFLTLPNNTILVAFKDILGPAFMLGKRSSDHCISSLKGAEVLKTLKALQNYNILYDSELPQETSKNWGDKIAKGIEWGLPLYATWGRSVIFWYVLYETFGTLGIVDERIKMAFSTLFGGIIASIVQLNYESRGVRYLIHKFMENKKHKSDSTPTLKEKLVTSILGLHDYFIGLWITAPYVVIGLFATEGWDLGVRLACLIPAAITGFFGNGMTFQKTDNDLTSFTKTLDLTSNPNVSSQQRKKLVNLVRQYKRLYKKLHPDLLLQLKSVLEQTTIDRICPQEGNTLVRNLKLSPFYSQFQNLLFQASALKESPTDKGAITLEFLAYAQEFLDQGKATLNQALGSGIGGGIIGIMNGVVTTELILWGGIFEVVSINVRHFINANLSFVYNVCLSPFWVLDSLSRNIKVISGLLAPSTTSFQEKKGTVKKVLERSVKILIYGGASITSLLFTYYYFMPKLIQEERDEKLYGDGYMDFIKIGYTSPCIFLNSLFFYSTRLNYYADWLFNKCSMRRGLPSPVELKRQQFLKEFKGLKFWFGKLRDEDVHDIHHQVFSQPFLNFAETQEEREHFQIAEALKTLWILRHNYAKHQSKIVEPEAKLARKSISKVVGWTVPFLATFGRSFIYWTLFYNLLGIIGVEDETTKIALSIIGGTIGSLVQGSVEVEATHKIAYDLTVGEKIGEDTSQGWARKTIIQVGKVQNYFAACIWAIPYIVMGITAMADWPLWLQLITLIPAGLAESLKNMLMFNQSIGGAAQFVDQVAAKVSYPNATQKRNQLVALTRRYRKMFKKLHPDILMKLDEILVSVEENGTWDQESSSGEFSDTEDKSDFSNNPPSIDLNSESFINLSTEGKNSDEDKYPSVDILKGKGKEKVSQFYLRSNAPIKKKYDDLNGENRDHNYEGEQGSFLTSFKVDSPKEDKDNITKVEKDLSNEEGGEEETIGLLI